MIEILQQLDHPQEGAFLTPQPRRPSTGFDHSSTDAVLFTGVLPALADADAIHALRTAASGVNAGGRILVFGDVLDPELAHEHDYEHDLIDFALHGGGARTHEEHVRLFEAAGLSAERTTIGWGYTLYGLTVD